MQTSNEAVPFRARRIHDPMDAKRLNSEPSIMFRDAAGVKKMDKKK